jgi:hypothetical protein
MIREQVVEQKLTEMGIMADCNKDEVITELQQLVKEFDNETRTNTKIGELSTNARDINSEFSIQGR